MKSLLLTLPKTRLPKYQKLADSVRTAIREGTLKPGEILPSTRELAKKFKMNRHTVMNAYSELVAEGWIEAKEKVSYQVMTTLPSTFLQSKASVKQSFEIRDPKFEIARPLKVEDYSTLEGYRYSFPSGFPDPRLFPLKEFKSFLYDALKARQVLLYGDPVGEPELLDQVTTYLRRVRNVTDRTVIITNGSQEAIFLLAQLLIQPGDTVAVEALGYPPAIEALRFAGAHIVPIQVDLEGLVTDDLEKLLNQKKVKLIYTTPLHQYPTTVTLSATRRLRLYELAYKHGVLILEDDYDHEFHYASQPVAPLASFDPAGIVLYVSTFSKILFPSARIGFLAVPSALGKELAKLKRISSRQNEHLLQKTVALWMASGGFERHLRRVRRAYEERLNSVNLVLNNLKTIHPQIHWQIPDGGMAIWLDTGEDSKKLTERARQKGVLVYPEQNYSLNNKPGTHLRLGFSGQTPAENRSGLKALFSVLKK